MNHLLLPLISVSMFFAIAAKAQTSADDISDRKEYTSVIEALKNPSKVYRLDLSNQKVDITDSVWKKFSNLEYLSFKNDHLKQLPIGIGSLKKLKVLDLSGNDFTMLPPTFVNLNNLEELYLNNEKNFKLDKNILLLSKLINLKSLHLENDNLYKLPKSIYKLKKIESLYINDNHFKEIPVEIKGLKVLKYVDLHHNDFKSSINGLQKIPYGIKINF